MTQTRVLTTLVISFSSFLFALPATALASKCDRGAEACVRAAGFKTKLSVREYTARYAELNAARAKVYACGPDGVPYTPTNARSPCAKKTPSAE